MSEKPKSETNTAKMEERGIEQLKLQAKSVRKQRRVLKQLLNDLNGQIMAEALKALPEENRPAEPVMPMTWECLFDPEEERDPEFPRYTNPAGFCIYDDEADPCHDFCLFCGHPEERK